MSKTCAKCGTSFEDDARFCTNCGSNEFISKAETQQQYYTPQGNQDFYTPVAPEKKSKKRAAKVTIGVILIIALVATLLIVFLGRKPYQSAINNIEDIIAGEFEAVEKLAPEKCWDKFKDTHNITAEDLSDELADAWDDIEKLIDTVYGSDFRISTKILMDEEIEGRDLKNIKEVLEVNYDIDADEVGDGYFTKIQITIEGSEDIDTISLPISFIEISGEWYPMVWLGKYDSSLNGVVLITDTGRVVDGIESIMRRF